MIKKNLSYSQFYYIKSLWLIVLLQFLFEFSSMEQVNILDEKININHMFVC